MKVYRDGDWRNHATRMYNVQCWYADNACEIFQILADSYDHAIERARVLAQDKGYNFCDFVI